MAHNIRLYARPASGTGDSCTLAFDGKFEGYTPGLAYQGDVFIVGASGNVSVVSIVADLPPGATAKLVNGDRIRVSWPAYEVLTTNTTDVSNKGFEDGDTGWIKGAGIRIDGAGDKLSGAYSATYGTGHGGQSQIEAETFVPVVAGRLINATFQFQQGASSAGNMLGTTLLKWYNPDKSFRNYAMGNTVSSGSNGAWHPSTVNAAAPVNGFVRPAFMFDRRRENRQAYLDSFSWNGAHEEAGETVGTADSDDIAIEITVRDAKGCIAVLSTVIKAGPYLPARGEWRYKQVLDSDTTDYSSPLYDDSGWSLGRGPFAGFEDGTQEWNGPALWDANFGVAFTTAWDTNTRLWMRRTFTLGAIPPGGLKLVGYIEDHADIYFNGNLVHSTPLNPNGGNGFEVYIPESALQVGVNAIALNCADEPPNVGTSVVYADLYIEPAPSDGFAFGAFLAQGPIYIAHRAAGNLYPEETDIAYARSAAAGLVMMEQDTVLTADGSLVCSHDTDATYMTTSSANWNTLHEADIAGLTVDSGSFMGVSYTPAPKMMLFRDVLSTYKGQFIFFPEIKDHGDTEMVAELQAAGIPGHQAVVSSFDVADLAAAKAAGFKTMLGSNSSDVTSTAASNGIDCIVYPASVSSSWFTNGVAAGKLMFAYTINRRKDRDAMLALGCAGMYCDDPMYVSTDAPISTTDNFATQEWQSGMIPNKSGIVGDARPTAEYRGKFFAPNAWGYDDNASTAVYRGCLMGHMCPVGGVAANDTYSVSFKVKFGAPSDGNQLRWASIAIAATDQAFLDDTNGTANPNSYHFLMRKSGSLEIFKRNSAAGTVLSVNQDGAAIADDEVVAFRLIVTPEKLRLERLDGSGNVVAAVESGDKSAGYRGGYFHLGHSRLPVQFSDVSTGAVPSMPWTLFNLASAPKLILDDNSPVTDAGSGACSQWNDVSGNGYHFTQGTSAPQPGINLNIVNGHRAINFNGTQDYMDAPAGVNSMFKNTNKAWVFCCYRKAAADGANTERSLFLSSVNGSASTRIGMFASPNTAANKLGFGGRRLDADSFYGPTSATAKSAVWVMALGLIDYSARTITVYVDGAIDNQLTGQFTAAGSTSNTDSLRTRLGANAGTTAGSFFDGRIHTLAAGSGSLPSSDEIDKMFGFAAHHLGLAANLPALHPYKSAPPTV